MKYIIDFKKTFDGFVSRYPDAWANCTGGNNSPVDVTYIADNFVVYFHGGGQMPLNELSYYDLGTVSAKSREKYKVFTKRYNKRNIDMFCSFAAITIVSSACEKLKRNWSWT